MNTSRNLNMNINEPIKEGFANIMGDDDDDENDDEEEPLNDDNENLDMNVNNYSTQELLKMLNLREPTYEKLRSRTSELISQFRTEGNMEMINFIQNVEQKLSQDIYKQSGAAYYNEQQDSKTLIGQWWQNNHLRQKDYSDSNKPSYRRNKIRIFDEHTQFPMKREFLGINHVFNVDVAQGEVNPNLVNTTNQLITIDSKYREFIFPYDASNSATNSSPTNFSMMLNSTLKECISLSVNSVTLPKTWYNIDASIGNNYFYVGGTVIQVPSGFYEPTTLQTELQNSINNILLVDPLFPLNNVTYNTQSGKFVLNFTNAFGIMPLDVSLIFWDKDGSYNPVNTTGTSRYCSNQPLNQPKVDYNLGWTIGFRSQPNANGLSALNITIPPLTATYPITPPAVPDLAGTKHVYLVIDDNNQNKLNTGTLGIAKQINTPTSLPTSYSAYYADASYVCLPGTNNPVIFNPDEGRARVGQLTQVQLYVLNQSQYNVESYQWKDRVFGPQKADILGVIPVTSFNVPWGQNIVAIGPNLLANKRVYFGPVSLNRFKVQLIDDLGNVINLNGRDWCCTLNAEQLYQY